MDGDIGTIGITDFAAAALGDIVFVDLPSVGSKYSAGDSFGSVESVKAASDVYVPVAGEVVEVNAVSFPWFLVFPVLMLEHLQLPFPSGDGCTFPQLTVPLTMFPSHIPIRTDP